MIQFTVHGVAQPAGSKKAFAIRKGGVPTGQIAVSDANKKSKPWKQEVAAAAREAYQGPVLEGPLRATIKFFKVRPKGHFKASGALSKAGNDTPFPTMKPDVLKLARGIEDALSSVLYRDDAQIVDERILKNWGTSAYVEVTIEPVLPGRCQSCNVSEAEPMHECPYSEISGSDDLCNCCDGCAHSCAQEV